MQCPCGGQTTPHQHTVKSQGALLGWLPGTKLRAPAVVWRDVCQACGRQGRVQAYSVKASDLVQAAPLRRMPLKKSDLAFILRHAG